MTMEPIAVQLSPYEKVKILRDQLEERKVEITEVESVIRTKQQEIATHRFLEGLSPYYAMQGVELPSPDEIKQLEERRRLLYELVATIESEIPTTLAMAESGDAPVPQPTQAASAPSTAGPARKAKFDF
ncbi:MAG: hypothetical protein ACYTGH_04920 [Planctomycetota bacterium]|jgi:hypothetical protein